MIKIFSKKIYVILIGILLLMVLTFLAFYHFVIRSITFEYYDWGVGIRSGDYEAIRLIAEGNEIRFPMFKGKMNNFGIDYTPIAAAFNMPLSEYAYDIFYTYDYYAKLNYEVNKTKKETITVKFFGFGYPDKGAGEPVPLDKVFVFDIRGVTPRNFPDVLPKLISD